MKTLPSHSHRNDLGVAMRVKYALCTLRQVDNHHSIAQVAVYFFDLELGGLSQWNGRFLLQNVPAGTHTLTVWRIGYETLQRRIAVTDGQTVEYNIAISETPPSD